MTQMIVSNMSADMATCAIVQNCITGGYIGDSVEGDTRSLDYSSRMLENPEAFLN